jgi:hypothetical protein
MRKRIRMAVPAGVVLLLGVGVFVVWPVPDRITRENLDRIHKGMSKAEVEAILGPQGDYSTGKTETLGWEMEHGFGRSSDWWGATSSMHWSSDTLSIEVAFHADGTAAGSQALITKRLDQGPLDNLLWRAKRQWHRWFPDDEL